MTTKNRKRFISGVSVMLASGLIELLRYLNVPGMGMIFVRLILAALLTVGIYSIFMRFQNTEAKPPTE